MNGCPFHKVRDGLPPLTPKLAKLPVDERGYPVPWFVQWIDGKPEFRAIDPRKWVQAVKQRLCWVCGEPLGSHLAFVIGPMCMINRTTAEPPNHLQCAEWSVKGCPFLSKPQMVRREDDFTREHMQDAPGVMIKRNPGAMAIVVTRDYKVFPDGRGSLLIRIGEPQEITWWKEGRAATRDEVLHAIETGLPSLLEVCQNEEERSEVLKQRDAMLPLIPK